MESSFFFKVWDIYKQHYLKDVQRAHRQQMFHQSMELLLHQRQFIFLYEQWFAQKVDGVTFRRQIRDMATFQEGTRLCCRYCNLCKHPLYWNHVDKGFAFVCTHGHQETYFVRYF